MMSNIFSEYDILHSIQGSALVIERDYTIVFANQQFLNMTGMDRAEVIGKKCYEVSHHALSSDPENYKPESQYGHRQIFKTGLPVTVSHTHVLPDGSEQIVEIFCSPIKDEKGSVVRILQVIKDITENRQAEKLRKESKNQFLEIFNNISSGVAIYEAVEEGSDFVIKDLNPAGCRSSQVRKEDIVGKRVREVFPGIEELGLFEVFQRVFKSGQSVFHPTAMYKDDNLELWVENYVCKLPSGEIVAVYDDVTERKQNERELALSKEEWEKTFHAVTDIVALQDPSMKVVKINQAGCDALGLECSQIIGSHCYELFRGISEPCEGCPLLKTAKDLQPHSTEMYHEKLGRTFLVSAAPVVDESGDLQYITHVARDITEKIKMEEQLFLSEKLATIAGLAAGISHEINTPLSAILQSIEVIKCSVASDQPGNREVASECGVDLEKVNRYFEKKEIDFFMDGIRSSALNASRIITSLLEFSRPQKGNLKMVRLSRIIDNALRLARADYDLKKKYDILNVKFVKEYAPGLPEILCVPVEIEQVILNLVKNAVQAMADGRQDKPVIMLRTCHSDNMISFEIEDNGPGIDEDIKRKIYDPFFTTKEVGVGTGLGLSVSYSIIHDKHNGNILVESEPGAGAKFIVELPLTG